MITIKQKLLPFSHKPGTACLIPGSHVVVEAFPTKVRLFDLNQEPRKLIKEIIAPIETPLSQFTVIQDLEEGVVHIWRDKNKQTILPSLEIIEGKTKISTPPLPRERLSFGSHKKQEWEKIAARSDFREIFPLWHRLGSSLQTLQRKSNRGMFSLIEECRKTITQNRPEHILAQFRLLFMAGFEKMMVPRLIDHDFQGIIEHETIDESPLILLSEGAALIRSLFVQQTLGGIEILPHLPPEFFSGRFINVSCPPFGTLHLEWTKKSVRRIFFESTFEGKCHFKFRSFLKEFRLRDVKSEKGVVLSASEPVEIKSGTLYLLDRFQK